MKPNILLITSDQHRADCFGFAGSPVKTPHIDQLAREGTTFANCITPNGVCQPARNSILTGLLPLSHGVFDNGVDLDSRFADRGFAAELGRNGYTTGFIGKAHFNSHHSPEPTGHPENTQSLDQFGDDWAGPYVGFEHTELMMIGHFSDPPPRPSAGGQHYERWYYGDGNGDGKNTLWHTELGPAVDAPMLRHSALPASWYTSSWVGDRAVEFLRSRTDEPFCAWVSFPDPHHPFDCPEPWSRLYHSDDIAMPRQPQLDIQNRPWWHQKTMANPRQFGSSKDLTVAKRKGWTRRAPDEHKLRHIIANYYGMISMIDHNVGRITTTLQELGLAENTVVVFTSDHGEWLGDHGLLMKGPMMYEGLLRVGLIAKGPEIAQNSAVDEVVSLVDLAPTFFDLAGVSEPALLDGRSLKTLLRGGREARDYALNEWNVGPGRFAIDAGLQLRVSRTRTHKLTLDLLSGEGELYDLVNDPDEMRNVFHDSNYASVRKELCDMIRSRPSQELKPLPDYVSALS